MTTFLAPQAQIPGHPGYQTGIYYTSPCTSSVSTGAVAANTLYLEPWRIDEPVTLDRLVISVQTLSAGNAKVGVFRVNRDGSMTFVAENNADMSTGAAANLEATFDSNPFLPTGWYAFGSCYSATPSMRVVALGNFNPTSVVGASSVGGATFSGGGNVTGWTTALSYVAGPTPFFPASIAAGSLTRWTFTTVPRHAFRKA